MMVIQKIIHQFFSVSLYMLQLKKKTLLCDNTYCMLTWVLKLTDIISPVPESLATCRLIRVAFLWATGSREPTEKYTRLRGLSLCNNLICANLALLFMAAPAVTSYSSTKNCIPTWRIWQWDKRKKKKGWLLIDFYFKIILILRNSIIHIHYYRNKYTYRDTFCIITELSSYVRLPWDYFWSFFNTFTLSGWASY